MSLLQNSNAISTGGAYNLESSLRFRSSANAYLSRTPASSGSRTTWTWSGWVKRGALGAVQAIISCGAYSANLFQVYFDSSDQLYINNFPNSTTPNVALYTSQLFRDPSAWYHIVVKMDTTQATSSDRVKLYVNGEQVTSFATATYPAQNATPNWNTGSLQHNIGARDASTIPLDGYITEVNFVDGQALTPSDFGEYDDTTGVWKPKEYTGTYGTNGFYLPFKETQQATGFNTVLYTGNGTSQNITGVGFTPDLVWHKGRSVAYSHGVVDSVRGNSNVMYTNATNAESNPGAQLDIITDGFTTTYRSANLANNQSGQTYVAWCWDAGSSTVSNTDGTITSSVRANPATGFSIVTYTGNGTAGATIGHGLGSAPEMIIVKRRSGTEHWQIYHHTLGNTQRLEFNTAAAGAGLSPRWNDTSPDANVFTVGNHLSVNNASDTYVAYCFSEVAGFSKFGSYTGNGSASGPTVTTGFRPAFLMVKRTDTTGFWIMLDNTRSVNNPVDESLVADLLNAETANNSGVATDFNSNGFEIKSTGTSINASGGTYIYMAFADTRDAQFNFDASGNKNNWTANNINSNASSETTYDIMNDVATLTDEDTANFATLNPLYAGINGLSASNLTFTPSGWMHIPSTIELPTDSTTGIYWEEDLTVAVAANYHASGVTNGKNTASTAFDSNTAVISMGGGAWRLYKSGDANNAVPITGAGGSASNGDVHMFAYKNGYLYWGINGSWYPTGANPATDTSPLNASQITAQQYALCGGYTGITKSINFGQRPFKYTPPTGFKKLNTYNLPDSTIKDGSQYFNPVLYTGTDSARSVTGVGFQPDLVWIKNRGAAISHGLNDAVRGAGKFLYSNLTDAEGNFPTDFASFDSDGFSLGTGTGAVTNTNGVAYVSWNWRGSNSSPVSNTNGTITSTVSANTTSGFSVVTYTGTGANATVGHGLGVAPSFIIVKLYNTTGAWKIYHSSLGATQAIEFTTGASATNSIYWNNTAPTNSFFTVGTAGAINSSGNNHVAYCFADVEGFSKFGSYTGNGSSNGPFVYTGFRPAFVMIKSTNGGAGWYIQDTNRSSYNSTDNFLFADAADAEYTSASYANDFLSNGFKIRNTFSAWNASGGTYIYMAFAENPFKQSLAR